VSFHYASNLLPSLHIRGTNWEIRRSGENSWNACKDGVTKLNWKSRALAISIRWKLLPLPELAKRTALHDSGFRCARISNNLNQQNDPNGGIKVQTFYRPEHEYEYVKIIIRFYLLNFRGKQVIQQSIRKIIDWWYLWIWDSSEYRYLYDELPRMLKKKKLSIFRKRLEIYRWRWPLIRPVATIEIEGWKSRSNGVSSRLISMWKKTKIELIRRRRTRVLRQRELLSASR